MSRAQRPWRPLLLPTGRPEPDARRRAHGRHDALHLRLISMTTSAESMSSMAEESADPRPTSRARCRCGRALGGLQSRVRGARDPELPPLLARPGRQPRGHLDAAGQLAVAGPLARRLAAPARLRQRPPVRAIPDPRAVRRRGRRQDRQAAHAHCHADRRGDAGGHPVRARPPRVRRDLDGDGHGVVARTGERPRYAGPTGARRRPRAAQPALERHRPQLDGLQLGAHRRSGARRRHHRRGHGRVRLGDCRRRR